MVGPGETDGPDKFLEASVLGGGHGNYTVPHKIKDQVKMASVVRPCF